MKRKTQAEKLMTQAVDKAVSRALAGRPIPLLAITKVYDRAWALAGQGHTADQLEAHLTTFVQSIEVRT